MDVGFDDFVGIVLSGILFDWNDPDDEELTFVSAEGGYLAPLSEISEVFVLMGIQYDTT